MSVLSSHQTTNQPVNRIHPPTSEPGPLLPGQLWDQLSPDQRHRLYQTVVHVCQHLNCLQTPQIKEAPHDDA